MKEVLHKKLEDGKILKKKLIPTWLNIVVLLFVYTLCEFSRHDLAIPFLLIGPVFSMSANIKALNIFANYKETIDCALECIANDIYKEDDEYIDTYTKIISIRYHINFIFLIINLFIGLLVTFTFSARIHIQSSMIWFILSIPIVLINSIATFVALELACSCSTTVDRLKEHYFILIDKD